MSPLLQNLAVDFSTPLAYIGPGAGFAVMGSFLIFLAALALGAVSLLTLPVRLLLALFRRPPAGAFRRVVIVGFDGMDPRRASRLMDASQLPHLARLRDTGTFSTLGSTCPPMSPVAWSTFSTGVNPGKHGIYDFLGRDLRTCLPELSSARITADARGRAHAIGLRKSTPFWKILGDHGVFSTILRVPITFPSEPFNGLSLAAMCAPDIRGTQGEFTLFDSSPTPPADLTGGLRIPVSVTTQRSRRTIRTRLPGPTLNGATLHLPLAVTWRTPQSASAPSRAPALAISGQRLALTPGTYSPWVRLTFRRGFTRVSAIARFLLVSAEPVFTLYVSPLNINPEKPALPISHPSAFSVYLAKRHGLFATLGLAEDTWALTGGAIGEAAFLKQCADIHAEREAMFFNALRLTRLGLCACVFDLTDRVQHTFMRPGPPQDVPADGEGSHTKTRRHEGEAREGDPIDDSYRQCDALIGRLLPKLGANDLLFVLSDHGFTAFRRGVNLNAWLREHGYLSEKTPGASTDLLRNVEWSQTRAYSFGLTGIYLNLRGREAGGIVAPGAEAQALKEEIAAKLAELRDPAAGNRPVARQIYDAAKVYSGPYTAHAPDLVCGWFSGYRHSWETAVGRTDSTVLTDNTSHWCGDHCVDRAEVPGVLFSNRRLTLPGRGPHLLDFTPTLLSLWNIPLPNYLDGTPWTFPSKNTPEPERSGDP